MTGTYENTTADATAPDNADEPDPVRDCIALMAADDLGLPRICLRRACRRQRHCGVWLPDHDETACAALLPEKPRALYDTLRVEAEVVIRLLIAHSPLPPPSPDPAQRWLQEGTMRIVFDTLTRFHIERALLRFFARDWQRQEPALLQGDMLERFEALMRIASADPDPPATEDPSCTDETIAANTRPPAGESVPPPGPPSADAS